MDAAKVNEIFERYKADFESLNARIYSCNAAEDILMLRWWIHLNESGDINRLVLPDVRRLSPFLNVFKFPTALIYSLNANGEINNVFWASSVDSISKHKAAYCGLWCRANARGKHHHLSFVAFVYTFAFEFYDALLGLTWQSNLLDSHRKLGYNIVGCIPNLHDEDFIYIVHLTRENFQSSRLMKVSQKRRK